MRKIFKKRLAKLALGLLKNRKKVNLRMDNFLRSEKIMEEESWLDRGISPLEASQYNPHECGTTCCFVGYAPQVFHDDKSFRRMLNSPEMKTLAETITGVTHDVGATSKQWCLLSEWVIGEDSESVMWENLFGGGWEDDVKQTVHRALIVLEDPENANETEFDTWDFPETLPKITYKELQRRLEAFL